MNEPVNTDNKALADQIKVLEDLPQRGPVLQGLEWLRELQRYRMYGAVAADKERVRSVVYDAINAPGAPVRTTTWCVEVADRVAEQLAGTSTKPHHADRQAIPVIKDGFATFELDLGQAGAAMPAWQSKIHAAADQIDREANIVPPPRQRRIPIEQALHRLELRAKEATGGRWDAPSEGPASKYHAVVSDEGGMDQGYGGNLIGESFAPRDGAYVVAAQPRNILALVAAVREMLPLVRAWIADERASAARVGGPWEVEADNQLNHIEHAALTVEVR